MTEHRSVTLLRAANPVPSPVDPDRDAAERELLLQRIRAEAAYAGPTAGDFDQPGRRRRRGLLVAALVVGVLALTALPGTRLQGWLLPEDGGAVAATPELLDLEHAPRVRGTAAALRDLAARVGRLPDDVGTGSVSEVRYRSWSLATQVDADTVSSEVVPEEVTRVLDAQGHGTVTIGQGIDGEASETVVVEDGARVARLPRSLAEVSALLGDGRRGDPAARFSSVRDVLLERPAGPMTRAALLRYLAQTPGVASVGDVRDRVGRTGWGITVDSDASGLPTRHLLLLDRETGTVLGYEEMLTEDAGRLGVPIPSVISYVAWTSAAFRAGP